MPGLPSPLVFLDVDGVLNDIEATVALAVAEAEERDEVAERFAVDVFRSHGHRVAIPRYMPELVQELDARAEIWWCTTWRGRANDELAAHLGVGPFPVVDSDGDDLSFAWKPESVRPLADAAAAAGRTVIWIEDFNADYPDIEGVHFVDTGERGVLRWSDLPVHLIE